MIDQIQSMTPSHVDERFSYHQSPTLPLSKERWSDQQLLQLCYRYGSQAKLWKQRFLGLLPEVENRKLYEQQGCSSVFEFAAKLGGVSREQVQIALRLDHRFEAMPELKQALLSGEVSVNKLARVVSVATPQNQAFWATQSRILSKPALETLIRDSKSLPRQTFGHNKSKKVLKIPQSDELHLNPEITQRLLELQNKGIDLNQILGELLNQREERIQKEKQQVAKKLGQRLEGTATTRYIPAKIKKIIKQEYGTKCAQEHCQNQSITIHHTRRFALNSSHNPLYLAPLCKSHHEIAHSIDMKVIEKRMQY